MNDQNISSKVDIGENRNNIILSIPCESEKFAEFISGLMGKPQEISRKFIGTLCLKLQDVENFYHLIEQRVQEQQKANLIQFHVAINYTDGSSVKLGSLQKLKEYSEVRPLICRGVSLSWIYLVWFPNKENPERQAIDIDIKVGSNSRFTVIEHNSDLFGSEFMNISSSRTGIIMIRINHTARSWGSDIENLLSGHIENFMVDQEGKSRKFFRDYSVYILLISFFSSCSIFISAAYAIFYYWSLYISHEYDRISAINDDKIFNKIDFIANAIGSGQNSIIAILSPFYVIVSLIVSISIAISIKGRASRSKPSFILLSRASENKMEEIMEGYNKSWTTFLMAFIGNITTGIVGNIVYTLLPLK